MASSSSYPRIAILGAGPVGLTLASLLHKYFIPHTLFELRPSPFNNPPTSPTSPSVISASLDLHEESGLLALRQCGLYDKFRELASSCTEETIVADKHGVRRFHDGGEKGSSFEANASSRPEIARNDLTSLLLSSLVDKDSSQQTSIIKWECKVLSILPSPTFKSYVIKYTDLTSSPPRTHEEEFDLVLSAEGAWSRLRSLLTDVTPHHSTVSCITLTIPSIQTSYPHLASFVGSGTYFSGEAYRSLMVQRGSLGSARIYLMIRYPDHAVPSSPLSTSSGEKGDKGDEKHENAYLAQQNLLNKTPSQLREVLLNEGGLYSTWGKDHKELIIAGCTSGEEVTIRGLYMLPTNHTWPYRRGLTLLGDAAHLMTPFSGEGVNMGMLDAVELASLLIPALQGLNEHSEMKEVERMEERIISEGEIEVNRPDERNRNMDGIDKAIEGYEKGMFARMQPMAEATMENLEIIFHEDSPEPFVRFFEAAGQGESVPVVVEA